MNFECLLLSAKAGNEDAITAILQMYRPLLLKYAIIAVSYTHLLETDAGTLKLSENAVFQEPVGESIYNLYTDVVYIIPDEIAQVLLPVQSNRFVMTQYPLPFKTAEMLEQLLGRSYPEYP